MFVGNPSIKMESIIMIEKSKSVIIQLSQLSSIALSKIGLVNTTEIENTYRDVRRY